MSLLGFFRDIFFGESGFFNALFEEAPAESSSSSSYSSSSSESSSSSSSSESSSSSSSESSSSSSSESSSSSSSSESSSSSSSSESSSSSSSSESSSSESSISSSSESSSSSAESEFVKIYVSHNVQRGGHAFTINITDMNGNPFEPTQLTWSLTEYNGDIIDGKDYIVIANPSSIEYIGIGKRCLLVTKRKKLIKTLIVNITHIDNKGLSRSKTIKYSFRGIRPKNCL